MGFWNNLFGGNKKKERSYHNKLAWMSWDIHNHLLPGIDDGCQDTNQSLELIAGLKDLGIHRSISTPHIMHGVHDNTPETIKAAFAQLQAALNQGDVDFELKFSAEYMIDDQLDHLIQEDQLCSMPNNYVLIEMSYLAESKALFSIIKSLQEKGFQPILAHPERYNYYHNNFKIFEDIKNAGCMLQLNLLSISKYYGDHVKTAALTLIRAGMYDFVGTDMHHTRHLEALKGLVTKYDVRELLKECPIRNATMFEKNHDHEKKIA